MKELIAIQTKLKAPKGKEAKGRDGKVMYRFRSCEDILDAVKDMLKELKCGIILTDDVVPIANRIYIKSTATLVNEAGETKSTSAFAREPDSLATMSPSQVTGTASSYARKYALCGLLAIDDGKDADSVDAEGLNASPQNAPQQGQAPTPSQNNDGFEPGEIFNAYAKPAIEQAQSAKELMRIWNDYHALQSYPDFVTALTTRRKALGL